MFLVGLRFGDGIRGGGNVHRSTLPGDGDSALFDDVAGSGHAQIGET